MVISFSPNSSLTLRTTLRMMLFISASCRSIREGFVKAQSVEGAESGDDGGKGENLPNEENGQDDMDDWN